MKSAKVIPLYKGESALTVSNYRPISLLPIFSKIFERLIYNRLIEFINKNKILSTSLQHISYKTKDSRGKPVESVYRNYGVLLKSGIPQSRYTVNTR